MGAHLAGQMARTLNLGCGEDYRAGAVNVDLHADRVDVRCDLGRAAWPFRDDCFDEIRCMNIVEHLDDVIGAMEELHRLGRPGCRVTIRVPHFRSACLYEDITHRRGFAWKSLDVFCVGGEVYGSYSKARFRMVSRAYTAYKIAWLYALLSRMPVLTDNLLSKYVPMASILFELEVLKPDRARRGQGSCG